MDVLPGQRLSVLPTVATGPLPFAVVSVFLQLVYQIMLAMVAVVTAV